MKRLLPLLLLVADCVAGTPLENDFSDTQFCGALSQPTCIAWAPDGSNRLFVSLKETGVGVVENGQLRTTLFATFPQLYTNSECGVLGLAFDPDYATNRYVYVFVTVSSSEQRIVRFTDSDSVGTLRADILTGLPTLGQNHDGGALAFGPDGKLYFAIGDNGSKRGVDANLTTLAAKVGRCNRDGSVPADNPFNDGAGPNNDYIWATGFRNPFTMTFRASTGELWLNVVGSTPDGQTDPHSTAGYEQVFVVHAGDDGGYDDFEGNQPTNPRYTTPFPRPCIRPRIQYPTDYQAGGGYDRSVSAFHRESGVLTIDTTTAMPYRVGEAVVVSSTGVLDGTYTVQAVNSSTQFTVAAAGSTLGGTSGRVDVLVQGGCITGGCFYDSTGFPPIYGGNFFYGDLNFGGAVMRAQIGSDGRAKAVTRFIDDAGDVRDTAVGPDGALYYANGHEVRRVAFTGTIGLSVSPTTMTLVEGGRASFTVRLDTPITDPVTVQVHKTGLTGPGENDIEIEGASSLTFTAANWNEPQPVTLFAPSDDDVIDDHASFEVTAPGFAPVSVMATATDSNLPPLVLSTHNVAVNEGGTVSLTVALPSAPTKAVLVNVRRGWGPRRTVSVARGLLMRFTPKNWNQPQKLVFRGLEDANRTDESMTFVLHGTGYLDQEVNVAVHDNDPVRPIFLSEPPSSAVVNLAYGYRPQVHAWPVAAFELINPPGNMTIDATSGETSWTPTSTGDFPVIIRATNRKGSTDQSFTLSVKADAPPTAFIIEPQSGDTISGATAEFFGGSQDDYGTYKAEFYVDDQLVYTDLNREAHYHIHGGHDLFDTTALSNGQHTLKMVVYDDARQSGTATVSVVVAN